MLSIFDQHNQVNGQINRRAMLTIGGLGFGGLSLANLLAAKSLAKDGAKPITTGRSTRDGGEPSSDAVNSDHLVSSIMHTLFDIGELRLAQGLPTELLRFVTSGTPLPSLH
jgi:hypothetical protein